MCDPSITILGNTAAPRLTWRTDDCSGRLSDTLVIPEDGAVSMESLSQMHDPCLITAVYTDGSELPLHLRAVRVMTPDHFVRLIPSSAIMLAGL